MRKILSVLFLTVFCFIPFVFADVPRESRTYKVGDLTFIAIKDLDTNMGKQILARPNDPVVKRAMPDNQNPSTINAFVLKTKNKVILFDTGVGAGGGLIKNLKGVGIEPKDINIIILTHMHGDHIGGLISGSNSKVFPNAEIYVASPELEYWVNNISLDVGTSNLARTVRNVYGEKVKTFEWGDAITPEVKAVKAFGHTPGHTIYVISSKEEEMWVIGDIIHSLKVQMADPSMSVTFDVDQKQAAETRRAIIKEASEKKIRVAGMHIPFPGIGTFSEVSSGVYFFNPSVR